METEAVAAAVRKRVLFICIGNSCRSQLAEACARHLATDVIHPMSAGLLAFGRIAEPTVQVAAEHGWSLDGQYSKRLSDSDLAADLLVNITGIPGGSLFRVDAPCAGRFFCFWGIAGMLGGSLFRVDVPVLDWEVDDPYREDLSVYRRVADEIEQKVSALAAGLRAGNPVVG